MTVILTTAVVVVGCENAPRPSPAAPTPPLPAVAGLAIQGLPASIAPGQSAQLNAAVTLPDGARKLADVAWESSDPSVATISATGLVRVVGQGGADITARGFERTASVHLRVPFVIAGVVHESVPADVPIGGARVVVQGGMDNGASTITDTAGRFTLEVERPGFTIAVSKDGFDPASIAVSALPRDRQPNIALTPSTTTITRFTGDLCADIDFWLPWHGPVTPSYGCTGAPLMRHHFFDVHRAGSVDIDLRWIYQEDYSPEYMWLEVRCGSEMAQQEYVLGFGTPEVTQPRMLPGNTIGVLRVAVPSPATCELKPARYSSFKGHVAKTQYRIDVTHPR